MNHLSKGQVRRPSASPVHGRTSWQLDSYDNNMLSAAGTLPAHGSHESSIDPHLRNQQDYSGGNLSPAQQAYPLSSPHERASRTPLSSHSRSGSVHLVTTENIPRSLPSQIVTNETFDDAYTSFILYCNPSLPSDTDILELRKAFRSPPRSDGKNFSTYTLFGLIRKLESKEIKTWAQLAIDLGVEPPAIDKGQSAQKVQQYAVRLKRWMHAMHVDAFFEYLLNKSHVYWTQIPTIDDPPSEFGRDGVIPEEDLALRALLPETRPKRGRRKAEDREGDGDGGRSPAQRARFHSPTHSEEFAGKSVAIATETQFDSGTAPWSAIEPRLSFSGQSSHPTWEGSPFQGQQWRPRGQETQYVPHPQSAITSHTADPFSAYLDEPRSAITPSKSRARRRHGPAVSSAWPSSGNMSAGKLRGRPPNNRNISDGPFSTFPANPTANTGPTINLRDSTPASTPVIDNSEVRVPAFSFADPKLINRPSISKPKGLSLQVPERVGGSVRLATPPPTVLLNGESVGQEKVSSKFIDYLAGTPTNQKTYHENLSPPRKASENDSSATVSPSPASDFSFREESGKDRTNIDVMEHQFINKVLGADWYDHQANEIPRCSLDEADQIVKQTIRNLRQESPSKETFLINVAALAGGRSLLSRMRMTRLEPTADTANFDAKWTLRFGAVEGSFNIKVNVPLKLLKRQELEVDVAVTVEQQAVGGANTEDWKKRYVDLQTRISERDEKVRGLKTIVMNALVASQDLNNI